MTDLPVLTIRTPDLYYLDHALVSAREIGTPYVFGLEEIERVLAVWEQIDGHLTSFGYDVLLSDGRRRYLQYVLDETDESATEEIEILPVALDASRDSIAVVPHWVSADHINDALRLVAH